MFWTQVQNGFKLDLVDLIEWIWWFRSNCIIGNSEVRVKSAI